MHKNEFLVIHLLLYMLQQLHCQVEGKYKTVQYKLLNDMKTFGG